jgi:hypothetical protein
MRGYDKQSLYLLGDVLDLPLSEGDGAVAYSVSKNHIITTLHGGPLWAGVGILLDSGNPDWLDAPQADTTDLDFVSLDFSLAAWIALLDMSIDRYLMVRGLANTDGWLFFVQSTGRIGLATCQAGATQATYSAAGDVVVSTLALIGASRAGTSVRLYKNGLDVTDAPDTHVDPLTAARELHIGILDDETNNPWHGGVYMPRAWNRKLEPWEHMEIFNAERHIFGL